MKIDKKIGLHLAFMMALAVRALYLFAFHDQITGFNYEIYYGQVALNLLSGQGLAVNDEHCAAVNKLTGQRRLTDPSKWPPINPANNYYTAVETPGYAWYLALLWSMVSKPTFLIPQCLQVLLVSLLVYPIYGIGRRLYDERVGLLAAWFFALWLPSAYLTQTVTKEPFEMILPITMLWLVVSYWQGARAWKLMLMIILFILGVFFRANLLITLGMFAFFSIPKFGFSRVLKITLLAYGFLILALVPWYLRNKHVVGNPVLLKDNFYFTVYCGLCKYEPSYFGLVNEGGKDANGVILKHYRNFDIESRPVVQAIVRERPLWFAGTVIRRFAWTLVMPLDWGYRIMPEKARSAAAFRQHTGKGRLDYFKAHPIFFVAKNTARIIEVFLFPLSIFALWIRRRDWRSWIILGGYYIGFVAAYATMTVESRYIVPHTWPVLILAAVGVLWVWDFFKKRNPVFIRLGQV